MLVRAFGGIDITPADPSTAPAPGRRQRLILALLVSRVGSVVSEDVIVDALWGDEPPASARTAVQTYVSGLRDALEPGRRRHDAGRWISHDGDGYRLRLGPDELDLARFEHDLDRAAALHQSDRPAATRLLDDAIAIWRDPPLGEFADEPWATGTVARWRERHAEAIESRVGLALDAGEEDEVIDLLRAAVERYPYRERLVGQQMVIHYRRGDQQQALAAYRRLRTRLRDDLGVEPGRELRLLEHAVLDQDPSLLRRDAPRPAGRPLPSPSADDGLPPARRLVGRDDELARLEQLLASRRCVSVVGPGGAGKSALAVHAVRNFQRRFGVRVCRADLARRGGRSVLRAIASELRVVEHPLAPLVATVADTLAETPTLLLVETCEVAPDEVADVATQLAAVPGLRLLCTSQVPLGTDDEHVLRMAGLARDAAVEVLTRLVDEPASTIERWRPTLLRIADRVGRLPLGLELAAGRLAALGPDELLRGLELDPALLASDLRPERQRSVRAAADWSIGLLDDDARDVLALVAGCAAPFRLDLAEAAVGRAGRPEGSPALPLVIGDLVDRSLLERLGGDGAPTRFRLPDEVAAAIEQRSPTRVGDGRRCVADVVIDLAQSEFVGQRPTDGDLGVDDVAGEIMAALDHLDDADDPRLVLLAGLLGSYFQAHGLVSEGRERLTRAIERFPEAPPVVVVAAAAQAGFLAWYQGDGRATRRLLDRVAERTGEVPLPGFADTVLGCRAFSHGDHTAAADHLDRAADTVGGRSRQRLLLLNLAGNTAWYAGRLDLAARRYREQQELAEDVGDLFHEAQGLRFGAMLLAHRHGPAGGAGLERAWRWAERSRAMAVSMGDPVSRAQSAAALAVVAVSAGAAADAHPDAAEAVTAARRHLDVFALRTALPIIAAASVERGRVEEAAADLGWYLDLLDRSGQGPSMAVADLAEHVVATVRSELGSADFARRAAAGAARSIAELAADVAGR